MLIKCLKYDLSPSHCYPRLKCRCKVCVQYIKERTENYKEKHRLIVHNNYLKNINAYRNRALKARLKKFGLTLESYQLLQNKQNGRCLICFNPESNGKRLSIDHCHKTGKVRGLLCNRCNVLLGWVGEDISILTNAVDYLNANR